MRLINVSTLELQEFVGEPSDCSFPRYAILSHAWGPEEVKLQGMSDLKRTGRKAGFRKIEQCCKIARSDGLQWAWVGICCNDKTSSAKLSEAMNGMFQWSITKLYRGWTLQELIGPFNFVFCAESTWLGVTGLNILALWKIGPVVLHWRQTDSLRSPLALFLTPTAVFKHISQTAQSPGNNQA
ncbi:het domain-containing protein [Seiridium cupressi]